jgi:tetraacyldisaccharide 4'-kinase
MRAPAFWWRKAGWEAAALRPAAAIYGGIAGWRMAQQGRTVGMPVVCIGNFTVGGAGKTPTALAVARMLIAAGERPFFLTRGYGGRLKGPLRVAPDRHGAADVGDEPLLLAGVAPTVVARDRVAGASMAKQAGATVVVMDDGFQNPSLVKDCSILVVEADRGIGNQMVFPAGPLRAPLGAQLARAHALLLIGEGSAAASLAASAARADLPVSRGRLVPDPSAVASLAGRRALAFAGIGNPDKFFTTLDASGIVASVRRSFPDHHRYSEADATALLRDAERAGLALVTTEKDAARLAGDRAFASLRERVAVLPVTLEVENANALRDFVLKKLRAPSGGSASVLAPR